MKNESAERKRRLKFAARARRWRNAAHSQGLTSADIALRLGVDDHVASAFLGGDATPSPEQAAQLEMWLGTGRG
jgi:ribosome-binding protein aMBF1 (putative translation factor)